MQAPEHAAQTVSDVGVHADWTYSPAPHVLHVEQTLSFVLLQADDSKVLPVHAPEQDAHCVGMLAVHAAVVYCAPVQVEHVAHWVSAFAVHWAVWYVPALHVLHAASKLRVCVSGWVWVWVRVLV